MDEPRKFYKTVVTASDAEMKSELPANMVKDADFLRVWDVYNPLLTAHQREITDLYFNYDLSLGEIAENKGVSRQSVSDCLNKCRKQLNGYEKKLGFVKALEDLSLDYSMCLTQAARWIAAQKEKHPEWSEDLDGLQSALVGAEKSEE